MAARHEQNRHDGGDDGGGTSNDGRVPLELCAGSAVGSCVVVDIHGADQS